MTEQKPQWSELEAYRCARTVLLAYGDGALTHATGRIQALSMEGDMVGAAAWRDIRRAIMDLTCRPRDGRARH